MINDKYMYRKSIIVIKKVFILYIFLNDTESTNIVEFCKSFVWFSTINSSVGIISSKIVNKAYKFELNFSLDAILLIYMNRINSPPMNMRKVIIAIHEDTMIFEIKTVEIIVYKIRRMPIDIGVFIIEIIEEITISVFINKNLMSAYILIKI